MAVWQSVPFHLSYGTSDGNWSTMELAVGDPRQRIHALHSSRSTALEIPLSSLCGEAQTRISARSSRTHEDSQLVYNLTTFDPKSSESWVPGTGCEQGTDDLGETLYISAGVERDPNGIPRITDDSQIPRVAFRAPIRHLTIAHTPGLESLTPILGLHALPDKWAGARDYWWDALLESSRTLYQSIPIDAYSVGSDMPALLYGYTAGALYRGTTAKLSIGGHFPQLEMGDNLIFSGFSQDDDHPLGVDVLEVALINNATTTDSQEKQLIEGARLPAILDTTDPFLELPGEICFQIARELGLQYDQDRNLFLMAEETLSRLRLQQPALRIALGIRQSEGRSQSMKVTLPFAAFDHFLKFPEKIQPYFPIRVLDDADIVLGRTLFQETYLVVDYGNKHFELAGVSRRTVRWHELWAAVRAEEPREAYFWRKATWRYAAWVFLVIGLWISLYLFVWHLGEEKKLDNARARKKQLRQLWLDKHRGEKDQFDDRKAGKRWSLIFFLIIWGNFNLYFAARGYGER